MGPIPQKKLVAVAVLLLTLPCGKALGQIQVAGDLFVDLNAANFDPASGIWSTSPDCGDCIGDFIATGMPELTTTAEGVTAISFNGTTDFFTADALTPNGLTGQDPTRSIEVWALNPSIASEETLVSWGRRGGPEGSNMAFNYGNHQLFGAVGHWGGDTMDKGWNNDDATVGAPAAGEWHHLAYTYDGTTTRVYANGELVGTEVLGAGAINTHTEDDQGNPLPIRIASQTDANGVPTAALRGSLMIGQVRIHDGVLSDVDILTNWALEEDLYPDPEPPPPATPSPLDAPPVHRFSFDEGPAADAFGRTILDSIGGAHGLVLGAGSSASDTELSLNGGPSDTAAYVDLPNGIMSDLGDDITVEGWFTLDGSQGWSRVFDFGSSQAGEQPLPGGTGEGLDYLILSAQIGGDTNSHRFEINNRDEVGGTSGNAVADVPGVGLGQKYHFAAVIDSDGGTGPPVGSIYIDGAKVGEFTAPIESQISQLNDVNNWLGRSNWTADANVQGTYDEFRLYDYALSQNEVLGNFEVGPDAINVGVPGDANGDGKVNAADLNVLGGNWQMEVANGIADGDFNEDGSVNAADLNILGGNWQFGVGEAALNATVPEPGTGSLLLLLMLLLGPLGRRFMRLSG